MNPPDSDEAALRGAAKKPKRRKPPEELSAESLKDAALRYLDRFDASRSRLRQVLMRRVRKVARERETNLALAQQWIEEVIERLVSAGLVDDERFAKNLSESLGRRGASQKRIVQGLRARGVTGDVIESVVRESRAENPDAELERARTFVRKRRLGPYRPPEERAAKRRKDLSALARAGFDYELARRVLGPGDDDAF